MNDLDDGRRAVGRGAESCQLAFQHDQETIRDAALLVKFDVRPCRDDLADRGQPLHDRVS
jgi:hypothetical protein